MEWHGAPRVAFVVVTKGLDYPTAEERRPSGARYTRDAIRGMLQFMGCKPRHAYKAAQLVFQKLEHFASEGRKFSSGSRQLWSVGAHDEGSVYVAMPRSEFYELVCSTLTEYNYKYVPSSDEIKAACSLKERRRHIIVLLCGTSGSGKSTLASILASRLGISTVLSTDSVRHMMRGFTSPEETPLLFASTYEAGEALRKQQALDEARLQNMLMQHQLQQKESFPPQRVLEGQQQRQPQGESPPAAGPATPPDSNCGGVASAVPVATPSPVLAAGPSPQGPSAHDLAIRGYKAQCELVSEQLEQLICSFEARRQSLVVEGVHLHVGLVMRLLQRHPGVVPFLVYIKSEGKHVERMAVRAKYMTLDPNKNKYVKNMRNIRWIQDHLFRKAEKHLIPCVENTNIDRSVGLIHLTLLGCLKRMMKGEQVLDAGSSSLRMLHNEYTAVVDSLAGMGASAGHATSSAVSTAAAVPTVTTVSITAAAAATPGVAVATIPATNASTQFQRESSSSVLSPGPRMLASPRLFSPEIAAAGMAVPGAATAVSGDGSDVYGEAALVAAAAVAAAAAGCSQHSHSNSQLDLPVPYQSCAEAAVLLLSSSPQHQHQQLQSVLLRARTHRRSSCGAPLDLPSPSPSPPHSGPLPLPAAVRLPSVGQSASPNLRPGPSMVSTVTAERETGGSPHQGCPSGQLSTVGARSGPITMAASIGSTGLCCVPQLQLPGSMSQDRANCTGEARPPVPLSWPPVMPLAEMYSTRGVAVDGDSCLDGNGGSAGSGMLLSCVDGPYSRVPPQASLRGDILLLPMLKDQRQKLQLPPLLQLAHNDQSIPGTYAGVETGADAQPPVEAVTIGLEPHRQQLAPHGARGKPQLGSHGGDDGNLEQMHGQQEQQKPAYTHPIEHATQQQAEDSARHAVHDNVFGVKADNYLSHAADFPLLLPGSPVSGIQEPAIATKTVSWPCLGSVTPSCPGVSGCEDVMATIVTEPAAANSSTLPGTSGSLCLSIASGAYDGGDGSGSGGMNDGKAPAAPLRIGAAHRQSLSPEQQQQVEAVLPVCMERLCASGARPQLATASTLAFGGSADVLIGRWPSQPVPLLGRIEEGKESGDAEAHHGTEAHARGAATTSGHGLIMAATLATAVAASDGSADRAASAAFAAARDAYSRFGDSCPEEVLRVVMESAILDEQMNGVTEQQHPGSPAVPLSVIGTGAPGSGHREESVEGKEGPNQGVVSKCGRGDDQLQKKHCLVPSGGCEIVGMDAAPDAFAASLKSPSAAATGAEGIDEAGQRAGSAGAAAMSVFAGSNAWSVAAAAALGAPTFLRTNSRRLGEESSSPSRSGYSSDEPGAATRDADRDGDADGCVDNCDGDAGSRLVGGGGGTRRRRPTLRVGSPGVHGPGDSDDPDGDGYGMYGEASPLQEYGSVYESATHDDMDEHGDEEEGVPLGRSNTIIRHLAGALVRSRMRASASAAAAAAASTGRPSPHAAAGNPHQAHRASGPPPAASTGAALRLNVSRKSPPVAVGAESSSCNYTGVQHHHDNQQQPYNQQEVTGKKPLANSHTEVPGDGARPKQGAPQPSAALTGVHQQLRQLLRGEAGLRTRSSGPEYATQASLQQTHVSRSQT